VGAGWPKMTKAFLNVELLLRPFLFAALMTQEIYVLLLCA